jgi:hypothetical protein
MGSKICAKEAAEGQKQGLDVTEQFATQVAYVKKQG